MSNRAAWYLSSKAKPLVVDDAPMPVPGPEDLLVRVYATAINPADTIVQDLGVLVTHFPSILGEDLAGEIVSVGSSLTGKFHVGERVVGLADNQFSKPFSGSFQNFCLVPHDLVAKIPSENISYTQACVLPLALCTAAWSIHSHSTLALPAPRLNPEPLGKVVVIWGASSSVGSCAVQLARAAGCEVATTSSVRNLEYCRSSLGAKYVFDYKSENVVEEIVAALKGQGSAGVMCCVGDDDSTLKCAQVASRLGGNRFVASVKAQLPELEKNRMPDGLPKDVTMGFNCSVAIRNEPVGKLIWGEWLTAALKDGSMKCKPDPEVVGKGLESIQEALDQMAKGVSAKKLVVEL